MYASSYRYMTVDEGDESMNKTITKWTQLVIHPLSLFRKWWDLLVMVLVVWNIIVLPVRLSFYWNNDISDETGKIKTEFWIVIDIMIDLIFLVDVLLNFNTGPCLCSSP